MIASGTVSPILYFISIFSCSAGRHLHFTKLKNICHFSDHLTNVSRWQTFGRGDGHRVELYQTLAPLLVDCSCKCYSKKNANPKKKTQAAIGKQTSSCCYGDTLSGATVGECEIDYKFKINTSEVVKRNGWHGNVIVFYDLLRHCNRQLSSVT